MPKLGSLFDGIAGFPLAASRHGITPLWASEIEPFPISVTKRHFPHMKHLGSVTDIDGGAIEPVDIITFGSPCQDLSLMGKHAGLAGERSGLFMEAVRIIREMRRETNGEYPTFAVWENVVGSLSSNGGKDFATVLANLVGGEVTVPKGGWTNAGVVFGPEGQAAWRVVDSQYWGVPQCRRRIFVLADYRGERAGHILFESTPMQTDTGGLRETREDASAGSLRNPEEDCRRSLVAFELRYDEGGVRLMGDKCHTLRARMSGGGANDFYLAFNRGGEHVLRLLNATEREKLQGFPHNWTAGGSDTNRYRAAGNSVSLPVVEFIMRRIAGVLMPIHRYTT